MERGGRKRRSRFSGEECGIGLENGGKWKGARVLERESVRFRERKRKVGGRGELGGGCVEREAREQKTREGGNFVSDRCGGNCMRKKNKIKKKEKKIKKGKERKNEKWLLLHIFKDLMSTFMPFLLYFYTNNVIKLLYKTIY